MDPSSNIGPEAAAPSSQECPASEFGDGFAQCPRWREVLHGGGAGPCPVAETAADGILVSDASGTIVYWNPTAARMYGYSRQEALGRSFVELLVPPEQRARARAELAEFGRSGRGVSIGTVTVWEGVRKDGSRFPVEISIAAQHAQGQWWGITVIRDATVRKQAEELMRIQRELGTVLSAATTLPEALRLCIDAALRASGMDSAGVYRVNDDGSVALVAHLGFSEAFIRAVSFYGPESPQSRFVQRAQPVFLRRAEFPAFERESMEAEGLKCVACLPVPHDGRVIALMNVASHTLEEVPGVARSALEAIAAQIGTALLRIKTQEALSVSEARFRSLFEHMPDFVVVVDRRATIQLVNRAIAGIPPEQMVGTVGFGHLVPEHQARCQAAFERAWATREVQTVETRDLYGIEWDCRLVPLLEDGAVKYVMVICADITARKKAEEAVEREHHRLRGLLNLYERSHTLAALELHDAVEQPLIAAQMTLEGAVAAGRQESPAGPWSDFDSAAETLRTSIDEARRLMSGLRPSILDDFGLEETLRSLVDSAGPPGGWNARFVYQVECRELDPGLETAVFRIVHEALGNARRHSHSPEVRVSVVQFENTLRLEVEDAGVGFDPDQVPPGHFGLEGIRTRAEVFRGRAAIHSAPGRGTRVLVELPVLEAPPQAVPAEDEG